MTEIPRQSAHETVQIYTEWANYYLERKSKRKIVDLSEDIRDGLLLAELIEVVTSYKVPDLTKKPKTPKQMHDNVNSCLSLLKQQEVGGLEDINASDICAGRLKAILSLFFALSRHKQASKQRSGSRKPDPNMGPSPYQSPYHQPQVVVPQQQQSMQQSQQQQQERPAPHTSIPVPATALVQRRCAPDKVRPLPPTPNQSQPTLGSKQSSKKQGDNHAYDSQQNIVTKENDVRQISKNPASPYTTEPTSTSTTSQQTNLTTTKHSSGLLRLFIKDKTPRAKSQVSSNARASSSSGFSSAKSEKSDSSISLNELQTSSKVKILSDTSKKVKSSGSPKTKNKLLVSKSSKKSSGKSKESSVVEHYSNANITIVETKGLTPKTIIPSIPKAQKPAVVSVGSQSPSQISQGNRRIEKKSESISNLLTTSASSNSQLPTPKPVATVKGTTKPPLAASPTHATSNNEVKTSTMMTDSAKSNNSSESSVLCAPNNNNIKAAKEVTTPDVWQQQSKLVATTYNGKGSPRKVVSNGENANNITIPAATAVAVAQNVVNGNKSSTPTSVLPMRPLLRGYNNRVTLPRNMKTGQLHADFCEDLRQQGYNSDSDSPLMKSAQRTRYSDVESGYMSEGGSSQFMSLLRNRSQLPTTIEEKCLSSVENILEHAQETPMEAQSNANVNNKQEFWAKQQEHYEQSQNQQVSSREKIKESKGGSPSSHLKGVARPKQGIPQGSRTALVSAVPRTNKLKVSGGTQTASTDFQQKALHHPQYRSFSLTGQGAAQLSQSVKERFGLGTRSLPKSGLDMHHFQHHRMTNRGPIKYDGSLSDTQTYAEVKSDYSTYSMWLNKSNTASRLSDGESIESVVSSPCLPRNYKVLHHRDSASLMQSPRLNRSNSIRSTKSEKMYPTMLSRGQDVEIEPYYCLPIGSVPNDGIVAWSQPTSPTPVTRGIPGIMSPTNTASRMHGKKNDELHGSQASLLSGGSSSLYAGSVEEKQFHEVRRLKRELSIAREQVMSLSSQLSTNAHVVSAFEQSLSNMTTRLQQLTATTEKKDSEILEMRQTIELLRKQSIQAGLTTAHMHSMGVKNQNNVTTNSQPQQNIPQQQMNNAQMKNTNSTEHVGRLPSSESTLQRHLSSDSMCSLNSISSGCSNEKKKKKGWLRSSFSKAFSRNAKITKVDRTNRQMSSHSNLGSNTDVSSQHSHVMSPELPPKMPTMENNHVEQKPVTIIDNANPIDALDLEGNPVVEDLKKQLREKDMVLTDIRLEALSSASQLENLKETVMKMRQEMINLKQNNERLQRLITSRSLAGSDASLGMPASPSTTDGGDRRFSLATDKSGSNVQAVNTSEIEQMLDSQLNEMLSILQPLPTTKDDDTLQSPVKFTKLSTSTIPEAEILAAGMDEIPDGKKIAISVFLGQPECFEKYADELSNDVSSSEKDLVTDASEFVISYTYISGKTTWQNLDYVVRRTFKEYLAKVDPGSNLGLNTDSISSYYLGEAKRGPEMGLPELLPCGYIVGHTNTLYICLAGVSSLAFDSLVPRGIVNRYVNLLIEHRRLILCGPSGTGKSYLARKLAEFLIEKSDSDVIATFNVDNKSNKELQQYLGHISEQAMNGENELPSVIILENLHTASELGDVFSSLLNAGPKLPFLIATMSQSTCNATNLQLHHNFRWILLANHMDPVKGLLARYLRRKLYLLELVKGKSQPQLEAQLLWLPLVWQHINSVLETHCSSDVTIGPRLFLDVPLDSAESEQFFINLWNFKLVPYIVEVVREGIQLYGRRGTWTDPCTFIRESWPWPVRPTSVPKLKQITVEEIGLEGMVSGNNDNDPLLEMLMRLQEAANCNGNKDDSDCESNMTHDSSAGIE